MKKCLSIFMILLVTTPFVCGQNKPHKRPRPTKTDKEQKEAHIMQYIIENGDTIFIDNLPTVYKTATRKGKSWRKYYRLVHNFAKVYPYALIAGEIIQDVDSTLTTTEMRKGQRLRYIDKIQKQLFDTFESTLRNMTISQGQLLLRLIDRETGITPYEIIRTYKSKAAAGFWQGIAKLFKSDMKRPYDPEGEDKETEELVQKYRDGDFNQLYLSIFGQDPPKPVTRPKHDFPQK